jgi:hypothetical protein
VTCMIDGMFMLVQLYVCLVPNLQRLPHGRVAKVRHIASTVVFLPFLWLHFVFLRMSLLVLFEPCFGLWRYVLKF